MKRTDPEIFSALDGLHPLDLGVVLKLCGAAVGETRNLELILSEAAKYRADQKTVACCFGFGLSADKPGQWCDFLLDGEAHPVIDSPALADAYSIAMTVYSDLVDERRMSANRIVSDIKNTLSSARPFHPRRDSTAGRPHHGQRLLKNSEETKP
jgi:hypothetical protein